MPLRRDDGLVFDYRARLSGPRNENDSVSAICQPPAASRQPPSFTRHDPTGHEKPLSDGAPETGPTVKPSLSPAPAPHPCSDKSGNDETAHRHLLVRPPSCQSPPVDPCASRERRRVETGAGPVIPLMRGIRRLNRSRMRESGNPPAKPITDASPSRGFGNPPTLSVTRFHEQAARYLARVCPLKQ